MKVIEQRNIGGAGGFTMLRLDGPKPLSDWNAVVCDGERLALLISTNEPADVICAKGDKQVVGRDVVFA